MGADQLRIELRRGGGRAYFSLAGELDMVGAEVLERALAAEDLLEEPMIVLDLEQVDFIDSTGLRSILMAMRRSGERGQEFAITPGSPQVQRLLEITGAGAHLTTITPAADAQA
jgi:anti-anti-sigma factor